jgi:hypothetical protein
MQVHKQDACGILQQTRKWIVAYLVHNGIQSKEVFVVLQEILSCEIHT